MELMRHFADVVGKENVLFLEFRSSAERRKLSLCFWEGKNLVMMALTHCSRDITVVKDIESMVAQLLSVVSTGPTIICCGDADIDFINASTKKTYAESWSAVPYHLEFGPKGQTNAQT